MQARSAFASGSRHVIGVGFQALVIAAIAAALVIAVAVTTHRQPAGAGAALAAKNTTSWIALSQSRGLTAVAQPRLGSTVAFDTRYPTTIKNPRIEVLCYQGGDKVYGEAGAVSDSFKLGGGGSLWLDVGGAAECTANLFYFGSHAGTETYSVLASTSFGAGG